MWLVVVAGVHSGAYGMEKKLPVMRRMIVVLSGRPLTMEREKVVVVERETASGVPTINVL